jgi:hypothetical protein
VGRRELDFHDFDAVAHDVEQLQARGYQRAGNWGLGQICAHLSLTIEKSLEGFPSRVPWALRKVLAFVLLRRILSQRRMRAGISAPALLAPPSDAAEDVEVRRLRALLERVKTHAGEFQDHGYFGKMTPEQWRQLHLVHCGHHLSFLVPQ